MLFRQMYVTSFLLVVIIRRTGGQECGENPEKKKNCCGTMSYSSPYKCCETRELEGAHSDFVVYDSRYYTCCGEAVHHGQRRCCGDILDYDPYFWKCVRNNLKKRMLGKTWRLPLCNREMGMRSGGIPDAALSASSSLLAAMGPQHARLHTETGDGAWCPRSKVTQEGHEWLMVDLGRMTIITAIVTQGRYHLGQGQEFVDRYKLEYQQSDKEVWQPYDNTWSSVKDIKIFTGNNNTYEPVRNQLMPPIIARRLKIIPYSDFPKSVCLRLELYGCEYTGNSSDPIDPLGNNSTNSTDFGNNNSGSKGSGDFNTETEQNFTTEYGGNMTVSPKEAIGVTKSGSETVYVQVILAVACALLLLVLIFVAFKYMVAKKRDMMMISKQNNDYDDVINHPSRSATIEENIYDDIELDSMYGYDMIGDNPYYSKPESSQILAIDPNMYTHLNESQRRPPVLRPLQTDDAGYMLPVSEIHQIAGAPKDYIDMSGASSLNRASTGTGVSSLHGASPVTDVSQLSGASPVTGGLQETGATPFPVTSLINWGSPHVGTSPVTGTLPEAQEDDDGNYYCQPDIRTDTKC